MVLRSSTARALLSMQLRVLGMRSQWPPTTGLSMRSFPVRIGRGYAATVVTRNSGYRGLDRALSSSSSSSEKRDRVSTLLSSRMGHPVSGSPWSRLTRPLLFTLLFTGSTFGLAYYLDTTPSSPPNDPGPSWWSSIRGQARTSAVTSPGDDKIKTMAGLIALNCLVFAAFQVTSTAATGGRLRPGSSSSSSRLLSLTRSLLARYGTLDPTRAHLVPSTLLTSGFSHTEIWHLGLNMIGLYTIGSAIFDLLGRNQFLAFYTSAICWSSLAQLSLELFRSSSSSRKGGAAAGGRGIMPRSSLGASGGIYALLGLVAWYAPDTSIYLIFLPFIPIKLGFAFTGMMGMDALGLARGWSTFGHAAHFTGGSTGLLYGISSLPEAWIEKRRESLRLHLNRWGR